MVVTGDIVNYEASIGAFIVAMPPPTIPTNFLYSRITVVKLCQNSACNYQNNAL